MTDFSNHTRPPISKVLQMLDQAEDTTSANILATLLNADLHIKRQLQLPLVYTAADVQRVVSHFLDHTAVRYATTPEAAVEEAVR